MQSPIAGNVTGNRILASLMAGVAFVLVLSLAFGERGPEKASRTLSGLATKKANAPTRQSTRPLGFDFSPKMQAERRQFIEDMIREGYWQKTEVTGLLPKLWVTNSFLAADEKTQNGVLSVCYAYWMGRLDTFGDKGLYYSSLVLLIDNGMINGRRVATYDPANGIRF